MLKTFFVFKQTFILQKLENGFKKLIPKIIFQNCFRKWLLNMPLFYTYEKIVFKIGFFKTPFIKALST